MRTGVDAAVARDEIRQLAFRYAWALDTRDLEALVELFIEDVRVSSGATGRGALRAEFERQLRGVGPTTLFVGNHIIDFDERGDDRAAGIVYCRGYIEEPGAFVEQMIVYTDRYTRTAQGWRFAARKHELFYGVRSDRSPYDQADANWPSAAVGRGTLPFRLDSWRRFTE